MIQGCFNLIKYLTHQWTEVFSDIILYFANVLSTGEGQRHGCCLKLLFDIIALVFHQSNYLVSHQIQCKNSSDARKNITSRFHLYLDFLVN